MDRKLARALQERFSKEQGAPLLKEAPLNVALLYPSPYRVAMSSLGYLQVYRLLNQRSGTVCERAMLPEPELLQRHFDTRTPSLTVERQRPVPDFDVIAISHAYELELAGVATLMKLNGLAPLAEARGAQDPLVIAGGPITFSNPLPLAPFADLLILGEGEGCLDALFDRLEANPEAARGSGAARKRLLEELADEPGFFVPSLHGEQLPPIGQAPDVMLPAVSQIRTEDTELSNMVLIEPERGCHRGCTFCVMRRSTNGGMRLVAPEKVLSLVPQDAPKVGLVGAAVTDHPQIKTILRGLVDERGKQIGISSLRADRLDQEFVQLLRRGGYRSMTVALDAASVRLRDTIEKNLKERHIEHAAAMARSAGMRHLKLYVIVGLPDETEEDLQELIRFALALRKTIPVVLGVSPFVPKFHTPLAASPFLGERQTDRALKLLKRALAGKVEVRGPGAREAYIEYRLAQGGFAHARAAIAAAEAGGSLGDWKRALKLAPERVQPANFEALVPAPTARRRYRGSKLSLQGTP